MSTINNYLNRFRSESGNKFNNECDRKYEATLSKTSLQTISKEFINQALTENIIQTLARDIREHISKLIKDAFKYSRRTRCSMIKLEHLLFVNNSVTLNILHFNYDWPKTGEEDENISSLKDAKEKIPELLDEKSALPESPDENKLARPIATTSHWLKRERVQLLANKKFPLSKEQQKFFLLITESCMGSSEAVRRYALRRIGTDSSLQQMLHKLTLFIAESVKVNVAQNNFSILLYLMRMVEGLLGNPNLRLKNFMHLLIPAVLTCTVSRQLCPFPAAQNHWALREYTSSIIQKFVNNLYLRDSIMSRIISVYKKGLLSPHLTTIYGSLIGLSKMGKFAIRIYVLPHISSISEQIEPYLTNNDTDHTLNKQASIYIRHRLLKMVSPILKNIHPPPDDHEKYSKIYGFLGPSLCDAVIIERIMADVVQEVEEEKLSEELISVD